MIEHDWISLTKARGIEYDKLSLGIDMISSRGIWQVKQIKIVEREYWP